jgi:hypothetical protein
MQRAYPWLAAIFFIGCLVLGYFAFHQQAQIRQIGQDRDVLEQATHKQIVDLQHQLVRLKTDQAQAVAQVPLAKKDLVPGQGSQDPNGNGVKTIHLGDVMKDHPEYEALYAKGIRRNLARSYGDGLDKLNLPPEKLAKLKDLLVEQQMSSLDAQQAAEAAGLERTSPAWRKAMNQASQEVQQDITDLLGPGGQKTLQQIRTQTSFQTQIQNNFAPDFADAGVALTPDQSAGLAEAMAGPSLPGKVPAGYNDPDPATGLTPHQEQILTAASQVLTPAQLQIFKADQVQQNQESAIMKQYTQGANAYMITN